MNFYECEIEEIREISGRHISRAPERKEEKYILNCFTGGLLTFGTVYTVTILIAHWKNLHGYLSFFFKATRNQFFADNFYNA